MRTLRWLWREPLVHFLVAGAAIYVLFALAGHGDDDAAARRIVVNRTTLLQFMQYRAKAFEPAVFEAQFDALDPQQRRQLIDEYVREEVLYREAKALGLERGDYVMRQRLVQKMGFLLEDAPSVEPTDAQLQKYLNEHSALYAVAPSWTFTHVFLDKTERGDARAQRVAQRMLGILGRAGATFNDSPQYSDRYPFLQNYVERTAEYIGSHFGSSFMEQLEKMPVETARWQGPLQSAQGWHLVLITAHTAGRVPALIELREQVADDLKRDRAAALQERAIQVLIQSYQVQLDDVQRRKP